MVSEVDASAKGITTAYKDAATRSEFPPDKMQYLTTGERMQKDVLGELADGTGGQFLHDRNDIEQSLLRAATDTEVSVSAGVYTRNI